MKDWAKTLACLGLSTLALAIGSEFQFLFWGVGGGALLWMATAAWHLGLATHARNGARVINWAVCLVVFAAPPIYMSSIPMGSLLARPNRHLSAEDLKPAVAGPISRRGPAQPEAQKSHVVVNQPAEYRQPPIVAVLLASLAALTVMTGFGYAGYAHAAELKELRRKPRAPKGNRSDNNNDTASGRGGNAYEPRNSAGRWAEFSGYSDVAGDTYRPMPAVGHRQPADKGARPVPIQKSCRACYVVLVALGLFMATAGHKIGVGNDVGQQQTVAERTRDWHAVTIVSRAPPPMCLVPAHISPPALLKLPASAKLTTDPPNR
jgi:hypothetical protein